MPITFAHPAAVLPFRKSPMFPALVAGSVAPDFLYVVPFVSHFRFGHTIPGLFTWDLFCGWLLLLIGVPLLQKSWLFHLPARRSRTSVWITSAAILAGSVTHLLWDLLTHQPDEPSGFLLWMAKPALGLHSRFVFMQIVCTLLGGIAMLFAISRFTPATQTYQVSRRQKVFETILFLSPCIAAVAMMVLPKEQLLAVRLLLARTRETRFEDMMIVLAALQAMLLATVVAIHHGNILGSRKDRRADSTTERELVSH